jgi:hypothetical protein
VRTLRRQGFETAIALPAVPAYAQVVALDARGQALGTSAVARPVSS